MSPNIIMVEKDKTRFEEALSGFIADSGARMAMLVNRSGYILAKSGTFDGIDILALSALATSSLAGMQSLAKVVGDDEFTSVFHQGKRSNIHISTISNFAILVAVCDANTTVGMVRLFARETAKKLEPIIYEIASRKGMPKADG